MADRTEGIAPGGTAATTAQRVAEYLIFVSHSAWRSHHQPEVQKLLYMHKVGTWPSTGAGYSASKFKHRFVGQSFTRSGGATGVPMATHRTAWGTGPAFSAATREYLDSVYDAYQGFSAYTLEQDDSQRVALANCPPRLRQ